ncbi:MAG: Na+ dependent nucleoside transporter N-terminal domain-containing protein, partial [Bacteroidota bacterium]
MSFFRALIGIVFFLGLAYLFSARRDKIDWRMVLTGLILQIGLGLLLIGGAQYDGDSQAFKTMLSIVPGMFDWVSQRFVVILGYTAEGSRFIFGDLVNSESLGFIFAVNVLPTVIFFSTLTAGLYYLGVLQIVVKAIAWVMAKTMRLSGAESLSAAGN